MLLLWRSHLRKGLGGPLLQELTAAQEGAFPSLACRLPRFPCSGETCLLFVRSPPRRSSLEQSETDLRKIMKMPIHGLNGAITFHGLEHLIE